MPAAALAATALTVFEAVSLPRSGGRARLPCLSLRSWARSPDAVFARVPGSSSRDTPPPARRAERAVPSSACRSPAPRVAGRMPAGPVVGDPSDRTASGPCRPRTRRRDSRRAPTGGAAHAVATDPAARDRVLHLPCGSAIFSRRPATASFAFHLPPAAPPPSRRPRAAASFGNHRARRASVIRPVRSRSATLRASTNDPRARAGPRRAYSGRPACPVADAAPGWPCRPSPPPWSNRTTASPAPIRPLASGGSSSRRGCRAVCFASSMR